MDVGETRQGKGGGDAGHRLKESARVRWETTKQGLKKGTSRGFDSEVEEQEAKRNATFKADDKTMVDNYMSEGEKEEGAMRHTMREKQHALCWRGGDPCACGNRDLLTRQTCVQIAPAYAGGAR